MKYSLVESMGEGGTSAEWTAGVPLPQLRPERVAPPLVGLLGLQTVPVDDLVMLTGGEANG